jgi:glutaredoxin
MMPTAVLAALALAGAAAVAHAQGQLWRWTDDKGRVHITDTPPPPNAKSVQSRPAGVAEAQAPAEPFALREARAKFPVTLFTGTGCDPCDEARQLLNQRGIPFREVLVVDDKSQDEMQKAVGGTSIPALVVGATAQKGFADTLYHRMLDAAGYPKTGVLPPRNQAAPPEAIVEPAKPAAPKPAAEAGLGPYAPGAPRQQRPTKSADKK